MDGDVVGWKTAESRLSNSLGNTDGEVSKCGRKTRSGIENDRHCITWPLASSRRASNSRTVREVLAVYCILPTNIFRTAQARACSEIAQHGVRKRFAHPPSRSYAVNPDQTTSFPLAST